MERDGVMKLWSWRQKGKD